MVSHGSCRHLLARLGSVVSYLQTTYNDVRRHRDAVSTQTLCNIHVVLYHVDPKIKDPQFHKNGDLLSPSRTSARTLGEAKWIYVCHLCNRCFSHLCYKLWKDARHVWFIACRCLLHPTLASFSLATNYRRGCAIPPSRTIRHVQVPVYEA